MTVDLETLYASTLPPSETAAAKVRRDILDQGSWSDSDVSNHGQSLRGGAEARDKDHFRRRESFQILKRDSGIRDVRQPLSPEDLSVLAWAPGVPSVDRVDYIFSERKGENTWVYILDTGVNSKHKVRNPLIQWEVVADVTLPTVGISRELARPIW